MESRKYAYPLVPKHLYPAVMFACKMIRENGYFNRAIHTSAKYYGVDKNELKEHVKARTNAGKSRKAKSGYSMKWFVVERYCWSDRDGQEFNGDWCVCRGKTKESVIKKFNEADFDHTYNLSNCGDAQDFKSRVIGEAFNTKDEALSFMNAKMSESTRRGYWYSYRPKK